MWERARGDGVRGECRESAGVRACGCVGVWACGCGGVWASAGDCGGCAWCDMRLAPCAMGHGYTSSCRRRPSSSNVASSSARLSRIAARSLFSRSLTRSSFAANWIFSCVITARWGAMSNDGPSATWKGREEVCSVVGRWRERESRGRGACEERWGEEEWKIHVSGDVYIHEG